MNTYWLHLQPDPYRLRSAVTEEALGQLLVGVGVRALEAGDGGQSTVDLRLERPSHDQALNEIFVAVQRLGYSVINATVSEWVSRSAEGAFIGAVGGTGAASSSRDPMVMLVAGLATGAVGAVVGSQMHRLEKVYTVSSGPTGWVLVPIEDAVGVAVRPAFAAP